MPFKLDRSDEYGWIFQPYSPLKNKIFIFMSAAEFTLIILLSLVSWPYSRPPLYRVLSSPGSFTAVSS